MTATVAPRTPTAPSHADHGVGIVLEGVSWKAYHLLWRDLVRSGDHTRLVYDDGRLAIVSPRLPEHEGNKRLIGRFIEMLTLELRIPIRSLGETTWKRQKLLKGCEPDECYYVQNEAQVRGRKDIRLTRDPPPDLVVEIELTRPPLDKLPIYAALGVPEVWHYKRDRLRCLHLGKDGTYQEAESSRAFPFLRPGELQQFIARLDEGETQMMLAFRDWVRKLPRPQ